MPEQGATYTFEDLSGNHAASSDDPNPYNALIKSCNNDPTQIQARYDTHRSTRAKQQRELLLSPDFPGVSIDPILRSILDKTGEDNRHNLTLWARPTARVRDMIGLCQEKLREVMPNIWLMPLPCLHMTALEFTHSQTPEAVGSLISELEPIRQKLVDFLYTQAKARHRVRLIKPVLTYDAAAVALSWLPGDDEDQGDKYTYHHLRADLWDLSSKTSKMNMEKGEDDETKGVQINTRYIVPSAHLTIARFVTHKDCTIDGTEGGEVDKEKMRKWIERIEHVNGILEGLWDPSAEENRGEDMEWVVGSGKGLDFRKGACWYGGGASVDVGMAIEH